MNEEMEVDTAVPADNPGVHDPPVNDKLKPFVEQELTSAYSSTKITLTQNEEGQKESKENGVDYCTILDDLLHYAAEEPEEDVEKKDQDQIDQMGQTKENNEEKKDIISEKMT